MSTEFAIANVHPGKLNALVKNIMRQTGEADPNEAVRLVNSGEWVVSRSIRSWREEDGVIYFSVTSPTHEELLKSLPPGAETTNPLGEAWIARLESQGACVGDYAKQVLRSPSFVPTSGVTTKVAVLKGMLFEESDRITKKIRAFAAAFRTPDKRKLSKPNAELACLIRLKFTDKEIEAMGLWYIVAMHEPIDDSNGGLRLLHESCGVVDGRLFRARSGRSYRRWLRFHGFAFAVSQVSSQP